MLSRLTLILTHKCNLRCTYCYADGGNYGLSEITMSEAVAKDIFDHFVDKFGGINEILFFGGEPLLALDTMKSVCKHAERLFNKGVIAKLPIFSVVTNGTLISHEFIQLALKYNFGTTISMDGQTAMHDLHRRTRDNHGTSKRVLDGIKELKSNSIRFSLECTYTREHFENGYSPLSVYKHLKSFDPKRIMLVEEIERFPQKGLRDPKISQDFFVSCTELFTYAAQQCFAEDCLTYAGLARMLDSIVNRPELLVDNFCGAGINNFAVNPFGQAYPCHMFNNQIQFCLGNYKQVTTSVEIIPTKNSFQSCLQCPVKVLCKACPARMYLVGIEGAIKPDLLDCKIIMTLCCVARYYLENGYIDT